MKKYFNSFIYPIKKELADFIVLAFCIFAPPFLGAVPRFHESDLFQNVFRFANLWTMSFCISYCFVLVKTLLPRWNIIWKITVKLTFIISMIETIIMRLFNLRYEKILLQLLANTNSKEASECITQYIWNKELYIIIAIYTSISILAHFLCSRTKPRNALGICIVSAFLCSVFISIGQFVLTDKREREFNAFPLGEDSFSWMINAFREYRHQHYDIQQCQITNSSISIDSCLFTSTKIVLIIGESFNRHHSSLYGYEKCTNPELSKSSNLFIFNDVISSVNATNLCFQRIMSSAGSGDSFNWNEKPLFPAVFMKAGYSVSFISNQFPYKTGIPTNQAENDSKFMTDSLINQQCFAYHNTKSFRYDEELVDYFRENRIQIEASDTSLLIFHLMGQHIKPSERFPPAFRVFTTDSYNNRPDLSETEKQQVADYDNATLYNDLVVNKIISLFTDTNAIVLYFADHGDEANDFRKHVGRSYDFNGEPDILKNQLDVPFLIWMSDEYIESHKVIAERISLSTDRPYMTDDISHLLFDLAGLFGDWNNYSKSIISNYFQKPESRWVGIELNTDYDCGQ